MANRNRGRSLTRKHIRAVAAGQHRHQRRVRVALRVLQLVEERGQATRDDLRAVEQIVAQQEELKIGTNED